MANCLYYVPGKKSRYGIEINNPYTFGCPVTGLAITCYDGEGNEIQGLGEEWEWEGLVNGCPILDSTFTEGASSGILYLTVCPGPDEDREFQCQITITNEAGPSTEVYTFKPKPDKSPNDVDPDVVKPKIWAQTAESNGAPCFTDLIGGIFPPLPETPLDPGCCWILCVDAEGNCSWMMFMPGGRD